MKSVVILLFLLTTGVEVVTAQSPAPDDAAAAARATLERIQNLRKERPGDGVLVFYEALIRIRVGERDAPFNLFHILRGRKFGLIPVGDVGFEAVWDDPKFQSIRQELEKEEPK